MLGLVLSEHQDTDYSTLIEQRLLEPLKMTSTGVSLTDAMKDRLAPPYAHSGSDLVEAQNWDFALFAGAGGLRSTAQDMMRYLSAQLGWGGGRDLAEAIPLTQKPQAEFEETKVGLGWSLLGRGDDTLYFHNGGTGGYRSFIAFSLEDKRGVLVLTNSTVAPDDIGFHLMNSNFPLAN